MCTDPTSVVKCNVRPSLVCSVPERSTDARGPGSAGTGGFTGSASKLFAPEVQMGKSEKQKTSGSAARGTPPNIPLIDLKFVVVLIS
jgi:hypothetical protein